MTRPHEYGFTANGSVDHLNPMNARREARLIEIERALKFDGDRDYRRKLVREFLDLTNPEESR